MLTQVREITGTYTVVVESCGNTYQVSELVMGGPLHRRYFALERLRGLINQRGLSTTFYTYYVPNLSQKFHRPIQLSVSHVLWDNRKGTYLMGQSGQLACVLPELVLEDGVSRRVP